MAAGRLLKVWLLQENPPRFPVSTAGGPLNTPKFQGKSAVLRVNGPCELTHRLKGVESDEASLRMQLLWMFVSAPHAVLHFTTFSAKTWNNSRLSLLKISQFSSTATSKFKQECSVQSWELELALPRTYSISQSHPRGLRQHFLWSSRLGNQMRILIKTEHPRAHPRFPKLIISWVSEWASLANFTFKKQVSPLLYCWWECNLMQPLWRTILKFLNKLKTVIIWIYNRISGHIIWRKSEFKKIRAPQYS